MFLVLLGIVVNNVCFLSLFSSYVVDIGPYISVDQLQKKHNWTTCVNFE